MRIEFVDGIIKVIHINKLTPSLLPAKDRLSCRSSHFEGTSLQPDPPTLTSNTLSIKSSTTKNEKNHQKD